MEEPPLLHPENFAQINPELEYSSILLGKQEGFFMKELDNIKKYTFVLSAVLVVFGILIISPSIFNNQKTENLIISPTFQVSKTNDSFTYKGKKDIDALTLLKEKTQVMESQPGFVSSINGRAADSLKKEFWSFYVNGKQAEVGAAEYITKDTDNIEWKIETY